MDEMWLAVPGNPVDRVVQGEMANPAPAVGEFRMMWSANYLYVFMTVLDPVLDYASADASWQRDSVEFFFSENNTTNTAYGQDPGDKRYSITYRNVVDRLLPANRTVSDRFESATRVLDNEMGYVIEARLPLEYITAENGTVIGFDVQINDARHGARQVQTTFSALGMNLHNTPAAMGEVELVYRSDRPVFVAHYASTFPTIDGTIDAMWANVPQIPMNLVSFVTDFGRAQGVTLNPGDVVTEASGLAHGVGRVMWSADYLFVLVEMTDSAVDVGHAQVHQQDSVEVYFSELTTLGTTFAPGSGNHRYRVSATNVLSGRFPDGATLTNPRLDTATADTATGWVLEMQIPFYHITASAGQVLGFEIQYNESIANAQGRVAVINSHNTSHTAHQNPSSHGRIMLVVDGEPLPTYVLPLWYLGAAE